MEQQETKITPQDIIDKEFRVKFRGFDMAEVDAFLEEVAENFFKLTEENTVLHEKILALQHDLETAGSMAAPGQMELPEELGNLLEDIKQDVNTINADLTSLKQDRPSFEALENSLKTVIAVVNQATESMVPQAQKELPEGLGNLLEDIKQDVNTISADLTSLKQDRPSFETLENSFKAVINSVNQAAGEIRPQGQTEIPAGLLDSLEKFTEDRQALAELKNSLAEVVSSAREATSAMPPQQSGQGQVEAELHTVLENFRQEAESIRTELATLKQEFGAIAGIRESLSKEIQELLSSHFKEMETKLSQVAATAAAPARKTGQLLKAEIAEEPEGEEAAAPGLQDEEEDFEDDALEFLNEDDILDVDKLRDVFQSVLDDEVGGSHESREGDDDVSADLLFLDDLLEDEPEPKVTFSMDDKGSGSN